MSLAAALRARFPRERLVEMIEQLVASDDEDTRRWALAWLADRTEGKAPDKLEVGPAGSMSEEHEDELAEFLTDGEHDRLDAIEDERQAILDAARARAELRSARPAVYLTAGDDDNTE